MSLILAITLIFGLLAGGGVGLAYVADGAVPGDALYGLDRAVEALQYAVTLDPASKSVQALAFAEERLNELSQLAAEGASPDFIQQAADDYGESINQAVGGVISPEGTGVDEDRMRALLIEALSIHEGVLTQVKDAVPEEAKSAIDTAIIASQTGRTVVEEVFVEGVPDGRPNEVPDGPPEAVPGNPPEGLQQSPPEGAPAGPPSDRQGLGSQSGVSDSEARITNLLAWAVDIESMAEQGQISDLIIALGEYENEVDELARALAAVAPGEERKGALVALLNEALARHGRVLNAIMDSVPEEAKPFIGEAIEASDQAQGLLEDLLGTIEMGAPPGGVPAGPPSPPGG